MLQQRFERNIEEKWQKRWEEEGSFRFDENDETRPIYSIDTPPPFTSGELHMGHVLSYSFIDFIARYKRMRGFNVYYPQGWDSQGFPTEVKVEKKFGRLPPAEFREKCVEWTREFIARMKLQMQQMGFSPDWRYEYRTMEPDYHRKVQLSLRHMYEGKLVYMSKYPVYWCPKCVSAIAKAELDDVDKSGTLNYIKFTGPDGEDLTVATTRPELLHACVAVMFNPTDERYKHLEGRRIKTPLGKEVQAIAEKDIDKEFGTGLVMLCTFGDKMDVVWMHRYKLPMIEGIDRHGRLLEAGEFTGKKVEDAKKLMMEKLEREGKVVKKEPLAQSVKVHDRCGTPIELIASLQWFADIRTTAKNIKAMANKIQWVPDFGISYLIDWVESAEWDWVISRQRIFGTPLPFYYCEKCLSTAVADEDNLPFYPEKAKPKACKECGTPMTPEKSTCDVWVDSSITPLIISGWPDDEKRMQKLYPSSLRPQGVEIVRTWAFYTIFRSGVALTGAQPWKQILLNGNVLAPDGKKMSKSLGNIVSPSDLQRDYPTDAIRQWAALSGAMAKDRPFSYEDIKYAKSFLSKVWNAARFVETAAKDEVKGAPQLRMTDRWILGKLATLTKDCTNHVEKFEYHYAMSKLQRFFWQDFCDDYLEYVKHRIYSGDDMAAKYTLRKVLLDSIRLMAPFTPHISEEIYSEVFLGKKGIRAAGWPEAGNEYPEDVEKVAVLSEVVSQIRQHKSRNKLPQNAELEKVRLSLPKEMDKELVEELKKISRVKEAEIINGEFSVSIN
ncbi:MAG: valine--tRNA ligase [Candidatus Paceibacterota bacterium]